MLRIDNRQLRWLWLDKNLLSRPPVGAFDLMDTIRDLGFVQIDTIQNVVRAHHHILWSRHQQYRAKMIDRHLGRAGDLFEHFTHDASMLPMAFLPMWRRQFKQMAARVERWHKDDPVHEGAAHDLILTRINKEGPLSTEAFDTKIAGEKKMWSRPPHKKALDYLWYAGVLTTSHRENFRKYYDVMEKVVPQSILAQEFSVKDQINWLCDGALSRLGVATPTEIKNFWDAVSSGEVKDWMAQADIAPAKIEQFDGSWCEVLCAKDLPQQLSRLQKPTSRLRILNPFDPAIRDRKRLLRYFGFDYTIEIFVPAAKRKWGYYVYPLLQGDRFVGRIELRADRKAKKLHVVSFWREPKVKWGENRFKALDQELGRFAKLGQLDEVVWDIEP